MLLIAYGYYADRVAPRGEIVLEIDEHEYTYAYLEERVKSDVAQGRFNLRDTATSVSETIARIQREELTRTVARQRGITVSDAELDSGVRDGLGLPPELPRDEIAPALRAELLRIDLPLDEYLDIVESQVLEKKIKADLTAALPEEAEQVNLLYLEAVSQANAINALKALNEGTEFAAVAAQFSQDPGSRNDGAFGWAPREALDPELADVAFSLTGRSGIIETEENFYIIEVLGKETRPVDPVIIDEIGTREFNKLLETAFDETVFLYGLTESQLIDLANAVGGTFG